MVLLTKRHEDRGEEEELRVDGSFVSLIFSSMNDFDFDQISTDWKIITKPRLSFDEIIRDKTERLRDRRQERHKTSGILH